MLTTLLLLVVVGGTSLPQGSALSEAIFLQVAPSIKYGETVASAKGKTARLGAPEMSEGNRTATWRVAKENEGGSTRIEFMVHLNATAEAVEVVEVRMIVEKADPWSGKRSVTEYTYLYVLGFVGTPSASWASGTAVGKLRWGMGPADAAKVCPLLYESVSLWRGSDLVGTLFYNSPFPKRITEMECNFAPDGLPKSQAIKLGFLDDRLIEVAVPAPMPKQPCNDSEGRGCWTGVGEWVDLARIALERTYGQARTQPSDEENAGIAKSLASKGHVEFRNWIWRSPGKFIVLRDSGGTGWSYVLYRDSSRTDLEPLTKHVGGSSSPGVSPDVRQGSERSSDSLLQWQADMVAYQLEQVKLNEADSEFDAATKESRLLKDQFDFLCGDVDATNTPSSQSKTRNGGSEQTNLCAREAERLMAREALLQNIRQNMQQRKTELADQLQALERRRNALKSKEARADKQL